MTCNSCIRVFDTNSPQQMPGARCPTCAKQGKEVWVIPGKNCHICGTPVG
ncbi:hypothetical protein BO82DRAFT_295635 [Aspergillus uvarum CBS 121591]|uniref:Uncharacterized protein n=1 Tax=Aspergillus uvarum CBS 121591 TaxID=1448315 RepID=A0A319BSX8_9EURO|nr:hypothetical protein BO82DRAFT_295635 [Aspergillus uvarum CBS 121591]PYH76696.1 hypothetical protein BO82DRAFT_295635 [Aspergillus uvarum CBS 121591]